MEVNPDFSLQMQNKFTERFPCTTKESTVYIKGKDSMIPFPMIVKKDSVVYLPGDIKDSIVYKFISVPGRYYLSSRYRKT